MSAYCLGIGLDTLTLAATLLTVVVIDDDVFDDVFGNAVQINAEGTLVTAMESTSVSPGACILARSWEFRKDILGW